MWAISNFLSIVLSQSLASKGSVAWLKLGGLVRWKSDSLEWWPFWFPFYPTITCTLFNISSRLLLLLSSNIRRICLMEGSCGDGGGGGRYGSGECLACLAERRTGTSSPTWLLLPPRVILFFVFPIHSNHDEKIPKWGEKPMTNPGRKQRMKTKANKKVPT